MSRTYERKTELGISERLQIAQYELHSADKEIESMLEAAKKKHKRPEISEKHVVMQSLVPFIRLVNIYNEQHSKSSKITKPEIMKEVTKFMSKELCV